MFVTFECLEGIVIREVWIVVRAAVCDERHNINLQKSEIEPQRA